MQRKRLKEGSDFHNKLLQIEQLCDELNVAVVSNGSTTITDTLTGRQFLVGIYADQESFPRTTDVGFYLVEE